MDAAILIGIPGSGKSTFYVEHFVHSHVRINLDMLRTHHRESLLFRACIEGQIPFVLDKANVTKADRAVYIAPTRAARFRIRGFYFESRIEDCLARNASRSGRARIPDKGVRGMHARLEPPSLDEGFDELSYVRIGAPGEFAIEPWRE